MNYSKKDIEELKNRIDNFILTTFNCIQKSYGTFGEIGIDFAIDKQGELWFIECNAKPGKDTLYLTCDQERITEIFLNPLEYSKYITDFNK